MNTKKEKMASTTKIMTATIILENCNLKETIEISRQAANVGGSKVRFKTWRQNHNKRFTIWTNVKIRK